MQSDVCMRVASLSCSGGGGENDRVGSNLAACPEKGLSVRRVADDLRL